MGKNELPPKGKSNHEENDSKTKNSNGKDNDKSSGTGFDRFRSDPIFRRVPKNQKKVQIDSRFKSMFHDDQFKLTYKVDKRGRPMNTTTNENLKKYYHLEEDDVSKNEAAESDQVSKSKPKEKRKSKEIPEKEKIQPESEEQQEVADPESGSDGEDEDEDEKEIEGNVTEKEIRKRNKSIVITKAIRKKLHDAKVDYARGEADFASESDDSSSSEEEDVEDISHAWGELDRDAERTEESTRRLALQNMDWDRVRAVDLMVLFHSFLPPNGLLKSVTIYPSEFGKERLAEEEIHGPRELRVVKKEENQSESESEPEEDEYIGPVNEDDEEEGGGYHMEKLRTYQLNRLKYYYAVLEFDSPETAEKIYTECDGREYESSATHIDLRYIPDDMEFDENDMKDTCTQLANAEKYRPRFFTTTALQQAKVDLTWDETDPLRKELTERVFDPKDNVDDDDLRAYLASSSDESDEEVVQEKDDGSDSDTGTVTSKPDPIAKYRALLEGLESNEKKKKERDVEMEITWGVGLKEKTEKMVKEKLEKQAAAKLTPWEEVLAKQKEKIKQRKQEKKAGKSGEGDKNNDDDNSNGSGSDEESDKPFSDDEVEVDMDDPFFKEELEGQGLCKQPGKSKKKKIKSDHKAKDVKEENTAEKAALELLLMDDDDGKHHFNLKSIIERETESKSKKKRMRKKDLKNKVVKKDAVEDNFEVDVEDDRFSSLFSSHLFHVDPSDPNFKNTKGMKTIVSEKQKRRLMGMANLEDQSRGSETGAGTEDPAAKKSKTSSAELSLLVKSIQRNTTNLKNQESRKY